MEHWRYKSIIILVLILILHSCRTENGTGKGIIRGGQAVIGIMGSVSDLFPFTSQDYFGQEISQTLLCPALTSLGEDGTVYPQLASVWNVSADRLTLTYIINADYKWSNGQPVSAADVQATYDFLKANLSDFDNPLNYGFIRTVQVVDSLTVRFRFTAPVSDPLRRTRFAILNRRQINANPDFAKFVRTFKSRFIGCGPFLLQKQNQQEIILKANSAYSGEGPYLDQLRIRMFPSMDSLAADLAKGRVDVAPSLPARFAELCKNLKGFRKISELEKGFEFIGWNLAKAKLKNVNIRKALTYALDRPTIVDGVLGAYAQVEDRPVLLGNAQAVTQLHIPYNPQKAESLFTVSGWRKNKRSGLLTKKRKPFTLTILTNTENEIRRELALNLQGYYQALGIKVTIERLPWNEVLLRLRSGNYDGVIISWRENGPYDILKLFHSANIADGSNFLAYKNPQADQLMEWALNTDNQEVRKRTLLKLQERIMADQPITILFRQKLISWVSIKLMTTLSNGRGLIDNAALWYWNPDRN